MKSHTTAPAHSRLAIRTVVVRISRKLRATYRIRTGRLFSNLLLAMVAVCSPLARALPQDPTVQAGQATVATPTANSMVVNQATPKAIIDWRGFSIGQGQSVQFVQPGASSVALNRVTGGNPSAIYGSLSANGQVFLVNPAGVMFAPGAQVNVGGLVASTLDLSNGDFLNGQYRFAGSGGSVVNQGSLKGRYVVLAAPSVTNSGSIDAHGGSVGLLAGSRVTVDPVGDGLVKFSVDAAAVNAAITNTGAITADGGQVALLASAVSDTLHTVINQSGVIRANSIAEQGGTIVLSGGASGVVSVSGTLEAKGVNTGDTGGTVKVLGDRVGLMAGAKVDASGDAGGGTVLVGGNFQGKGPEQNASRTYVDKDASIRADAGARGDGGTVIVWADDITRYHGAISARGGASNGDGGFVEVSGKNNLAFTGTVDAGAANGAIGTLLLDPTNITIVAGAGANGAEVADSGVAFGDGGGGDFQIGATAIQNAVGQVVLQATNNVTVGAAINKVNGGLTVMAGNDITVNQSISASTAIFLDANYSSMPFPLSPTGIGKVTVGAGVTLSAANVIVSSGFSSGTNVINGNLNATGNVTFFGGDASINAGSSISATTMNVNVQSGKTVTLGASNRISDATNLTVSGGTLALGASNETVATVTLDGGAITSTTGVLTGSTYNVANGSISAILAGAAGLNKVTGGTVTLSGANTYTGATSVNAGTLAVATNGALGTTAQGTTVSAGATLDLRGVNYTSAEALTLNGGTLTASTGDSTWTGQVGLTAASTVSGTGTSFMAVSGNVNNGGHLLTIDGTRPVTISGVISGAGGVRKAGANGAVLTGNNTYAGLTSIDSGNLNVQHSNALGSIAGGTTVAAGAMLMPGMLGINIAENLTLNGSGSGGNGGVVFSATNATFSGSITLGSNATISNQNNTLSFTGPIGGTGNLTVIGPGTTSISGDIGISGGLTKSDAGVLTLSGTNGYTGATTIGGGTLNLGGTLASNSVVVGAGAMLTTTAPDRLRNDGSLQVDGTFNMFGNETVKSLAGGGTVSLGGFLTVEDASAATNTTFGGTLTNAGGITKSGASTLTLAGTSNSYTGATTVNGGVLAVQSIANGGVNSSIGASTSAAGNLVLGGGTLQYDGGSAATNRAFTLAAGTTSTIAVNAGTLTLNGAAAATNGALAKSGAGTLSLAGNNQYTGATVIHGGSLQLSNSQQSRSYIVNNSGTLAVNANELLNGPATVTVNDSGTFTTGSATETLAGLTTTGNATVSGTVIAPIYNLGGGTINAALGAGTITHSASTVVNGTVGAGTINITGGTLATGSANRLAAGAIVSLSGTGTLALGGNETVAAVASAPGTTGVNLNTHTLTTGGTGAFFTFNGVISGSGGLVKTGTGSMSLGGTNTYTGATTIQGGSLILAGANAIAASSGVTNNGRAVDGLNVQAPNTVSAITGTGGTNLNASTLTIGDGRNFSSTYAGAISGTGGIAKAGAGTLALAGSSSYSGGTSINGGTLSLAHATAAGSGDVDIGLGNTLDVAGVTIANNISTTSSATLRGTGTAGVNGSIAIAGSMPLTVHTDGLGDTMALSGAISGGGSQVTKTGSGTVTMTGNNTYSGATGIAAGTLQVNGSSLSDGAATSVVTGATLVLTGNETVGLVSGGGNINLGANALATGGSNLSSTFSGVISGAGGSLAKNGTGSLELQGANTYSGGTTVNAGNLTVRNQVLPGGNVSLASGAVLQYDNQTGGLLALKPGTYTGSGTLRFSGNAGSTTSVGGAGGDVNIALGSGGLIDVASGRVAGSSSWQGLYTANQAGLNIGAGATFDAVEGNVRVNTLNGSGTLMGGWSGSGSVTVGVANGSGAFAGAITDNGAGSFALAKEGTGTQALTGNNTYTGNTTVSGGTLSSTGNGIGDASAVTVAAGGTLALTAAETVGSIAGAGTIDTLGVLSTGGNNTSTTFSGVISGPGGLTKQGSGTLSLAGINTYTGATSILNGTLQVASGGSIAASSGVSNNFIFDIVGATTIDSLVGFGNVNLNGGSNLTVGDSSNTSSTFGGAVGGLGALTKAGTGALTLSGSNTYSGATTVAAGTLVLAHATNTLSGSTAVSVSSGATLNIGGNTDTVGSLDLAGTLAGTGTLVAATYKLNGGTVDAHLGAGTLTQASGTSTLNGTAAATTVNVDGGVLALGPTANRLTAASSVGIAAGATLNTGAASQSLGTAAVSNSGTLVTGASLSAGSISGPGTASLGGNVTTTGAQGLGNISLTNNVALWAGTGITTGTVDAGGFDFGAATATGALTVGTITNADDVSLTGGGMALTLPAITATGNVTVTNTNSVAISGTIAAGGNIALAATGAGSDLALNNTVTTAGTLTLDAGRNVTQAAAVAAGTLTGSAGGAATLANAGNTVGSLDTFSTNSGFSLADGTGGLAVNGEVTGGAGAASITTSGGNLALNADVNGAGVSLRGSGVNQAAGAVNGGSGDVLIDANGGAINLAGGVTTTSNSATAVRIIDGTTAALGNISTGATGTLTLGGAGADSLSGAVTQVAGTAINAGSLTGNAGTVVLNNANTIVNLGTFTSAGGFALNDATGGLAVTSVVTAAGPVAITTAGGALALNSSVSGVDVALTGTGVTQSAPSTVNAGTGDILVDANDGAIDLAGALTTTSNTANAVRIVDGAMTALGNISTGATGTVSLGGTGTDNLAGVVTQNAGTTIGTGTVAVNGGSSATLGNANSVTSLGGVTTNGDFSFSNASPLNVTASISSGSGGVALQTNAGALTIAAAGDITAGGSVSLGGAGGIDTAGNVTSTRAVSFNDPVTLAGNVTLIGGTITTGAITGAGNSLMLDSAGLVTVASASGIGTLTTAGQGTLGGGTLTAVDYNLNGGTVNANLGAGTLTQLSNSTLLNGTSAAGTVNVTGGTLALGPTADRLTAPTSITISSGATLDTGSASQSFGAATVSNNGTLLTGGSISAGSITSAGTATYGGDVTTSGSQAYTGAVQTAAGSVVTATGNLAATNTGNVIGSGTQFAVAQDGGGAGTLNVTGDFAGTVQVTGNGTSITLDDRSAATPMVVAGLSAAPTANVTLTSASALQVDAAALSPVANLTATTQNGDMMFLNSGTVRNGSPGVLATGALTLNVTGGALNSSADPLLVNAATGSVNIAAAQSHARWLGHEAPPPAAAPTPAPAPVAAPAPAAAAANDDLQDAAAVAGTLAGDLDDLLASSVRDVAGLLRRERLVWFGSLTPSQASAPLQFRTLSVRLPRCVSEQKAGGAGCR